MIIAIKEKKVKSFYPTALDNLPIDKTPPIAVII
jgi:hypothetical protein